MFIKKAKTEELISIDINENYISILETSIKSGKKHVENFNVDVCPSNIFLGNTLSNLDNLGITLNKLVSGMKFKSKNKEAILAIPEDLTISQVFTVDIKMTDYDLENYIVANFEKYITQLDYQNCYIDFQEIEINKKDKTKKDILLVVVKKDEIDKLEETIITVGFTPKSIDIKTYALERLIQFSKENKEENVVAYFDVHKNKTDVYYFKDGRKIYSDTVDDFSLNILNGKESEPSAKKEESIEEEVKSEDIKIEKNDDIDLDLDFDLDLDSESEEIKSDEVILTKEDSLSEEEDSDDDLEFNQLNQDFYDFIDTHLNIFYNLSDDIYKVDKVILSGDVLDLKLNEDLLSEDLNTKVTISKPFENMTFSNRINKDKLISHEANLSVLVGLSVPKSETDTSINLHDWRSELRIAKNKSFQNKLGAYIFLCVGVLVSAHFYYDMQITEQNARNAKITSVIDEDTQKETQIKDYEFRKENIVNRIGTINSLQVERPKIVNILTDIVNAVPQEIYLTRLNRTENNQINIKGTALQDNKVFLLIRNLEQSKWLYDVKISNIKSIENDSADENQYIENVRYEFEIQMKEEEMSKINESEGEK